MSLENTPGDQPDIPTDFLEGQFEGQLVAPGSEPAAHIRPVAKLLDFKDGLHNVKDGLHNIRLAAKEDIKASDHKRIARASFIGAVATIGSGMSKLPTNYIIPNAAALVYETTHSSFLTGLAAFATYVGITRLGGLSYNAAINRFPRATAAVGKNFPSITSHTTEMFRYNGKNQNQQLSRPWRVGKFLLRHTMLAPKAYMVGGGVLLAAGVETQPPKKRRKLANTLSADGAILAGAIAGVLAPVLGDEMKNPLIWYGLSAATMFVPWWKNIGKSLYRDRRNKRYDKKEAASTVEFLPIPEAE